MTNYKKLLSHWPSLVIFLMIVIGAGMSLGFLFGPDAWYAQLSKPFFNPPNAVFGPMWTLLYIMIAIAGWRTWHMARQSKAMVLWITQMLLNWAWTPFFFKLHSILGALIVIALLLVTILLFIKTTYHRDRTSAWLFVPYALWVGFASILNASLFVLN